MKLDTQIKAISEIKWHTEAAASVMLALIVYYIPDFLTQLSGSENPDKDVTKIRNIVVTIFGVIALLNFIVLAGKTLNGVHHKHDYLKKYKIPEDTSYNIIIRFFFRMTGTEPKIVARLGISQCLDRVILGCFIIISAIISCVASYKYIGKMVQDNNDKMTQIFGCIIYGSIIYLLDLSIVNQKSKSIYIKFGRLFIAILAGLTITTPISKSIFKERIEDIMTYHCDFDSNTTNETNIVQKASQEKYSYCMKIKKLEEEIKNSSKEGGNIDSIKYKINGMRNIIDQCLSKAINSEKTGTITNNCESEINSNPDLRDKFNSEYKELKKTYPNYREGKTSGLESASTMNNNYSIQGIAVKKLEGIVEKIESSIKTQEGLLADAIKKQETIEAMNSNANKEIALIKEKIKEDLTEQTLVFYNDILFNSKYIMVALPITLLLLVLDTIVMIVKIFSGETAYDIIYQKYELIAQKKLESILEEMTIIEMETEKEYEQYNGGVIATLIAQVARWIFQRRKEPETITP